ncbi:Probable formate transporter [Durusdinium trenchii]|uniref:Probable formate transporter n=1 Tax=Durusdinium trenchii TaxID=1381693 RepID=A0ABP0N9T8_9DINO
MEHLRHFMISSTGSVLRAWIEFFDQDMAAGMFGEGPDHRISKAEFSKGFVPRMARFSGAPPEVQTVALETESEWSPWLNGLRELGYKGDVFSLFSVLDDDDSNELTLDEVDVKQATIWRNFRLFVGSRFRSEEERRESAFAAAACRGGRGERGIRRIPMSAVPPLLAPPEGFEGAVAAGTAKATPTDVMLRAIMANLTPEKIFCSSILGGAFIGYGAYLACTVGGACPGLLESNPGVQKMIFGAFGLPFGLFMTLLSGSELFTGNAAIVSMALLQGKVQAPHLAKSLLLSWLGNLVGAMLLARLAILAGTMPGGGAAVTLAKAKTSLSFETAFVRGLLCNWLVCMAVYLASMAKDATGKAVAIWLPISAFVTLGLEHSVANMFIIPAGIFAGAPVSWSTFFLKNLLPVTLGNAVAGMFCVAFPFAVLFGRCSDAADLEKGRRLREAKAPTKRRRSDGPQCARGRPRGTEGTAGCRVNAGADLVLQRAPVNSGPDQLSREDFCIGLRKCGWTWGVGDLNWVFDALQDQQQGILKVENLRWMGIELARKQKKQEAKARSKKWQALKRSQGISPQVKHRHFATFKAFLRKKFGNLIRAWRQALSQTDSMVLSKLHFLKAASRLGFAKESKELWKALDKDDSSASIDELDPKNAELLAHFKAPNRKAARRKRPARQRNARARSGVKRVKRNVWVSQKFGGVRDTWRCRMNRSHTQMSAVKRAFLGGQHCKKAILQRDAFNAIDSDSTRFITATEFANGLKKFEFERPTKLFSHFDKDGDGKIAWTPSGGSNETMCFLRSSSSLAFARRDASHQIIDDVMFLENWTPLPFLVVAPNYKARSH